MQDFDVQNDWQKTVSAHIITEKEELKAQDKWRDIQKKLLDNLLEKVTDSIDEGSRRRLFSWMAPLSPEDHQISALNLRHSGTCDWVVQTSEFITWLRPSASTLWIQGIAGAGKTILFSFIVKQTQHEICPDEGIAHFYFDHTQVDRQSARTFFATVVTSLASRNPKYLEVVSTRLSYAQSAGRAARAGLLVECIEEASNFFTTIYLAVDALDECSDIETLTILLSRLNHHGEDKFKLLLTSRANTSIQDYSEDFTYVPIALEKARVQPDIMTYAEAEVSDLIRRQRLKLGDPQLKGAIICALSEKSEGMFLRVKCQLEQIRRLKTDKSIRESLRCLPKGLNETYLDIFRQMIQSCEGEEEIQLWRLFRWLVHGADPLDAKQLAEAVSVDFDQTSFDPSAVFNDPPSELLKVGRSLIKMRSDKSKSLQLSHLSVKEFLLSSFCRENLPQFYMDPAHSYAEIAHICLTTLCFSDFKQKLIDLHPRGTCHRLYDYAISQWTEHYNKAEGSDSMPRELARCLLNLESLSPNFLFMRTALGRGNDYMPFHFCAERGLVDLLEEMIQESANLEVRSEPYGTPLCFAARHNQNQAAVTLLDNGADVMSSSKYPGMRQRNKCLHWGLDENQVSLISRPLFEYIVEMPDIDNNMPGGSTHLQRPIHYAARADRV